MAATNTVIIPADEMQQVFQSILLRNGFTEAKAAACAKVFTNNSVDGIYSHGVNRFPRFIEYVKKGFVQKDAEPQLLHKFGGIEQWDGNLGPGILNALHATNTAVGLAKQQGIGCVAMTNTNHWMRGGTYGWEAAREGCLFIGWTNTTALMPAWGAVDARLGNNPLVMALPYQNEAIVLDMAMSQYSFGAMEQAVATQQQLSVPGGYDTAGNFTTDPSEILQTKRPLPIGYWKGAGLSLLLELLAVALSGGLAVHQVNAQPAEYGLSQVFIAIDISRLGNASAIATLIQNILGSYKQSVPENDKASITWPGERVLAARAKNTVYGIPVVEAVWQQILQLQ